VNVRIGRFCDRVIEAGWLLAVVVVPTFFNVYTARVFEADKGYLVRGLALVMVAAWLCKQIERAVHWLGGRLGWIEYAAPERPVRPRLFRLLIVLSLLFAVVYIISTLFSIHPRISLLGSYHRGQGTFFSLCLVAMSLLVATHLRTDAQLGRLLAAVGLGSLPVTLYAFVQHAGRDPLPWGTTEPLIVSTMGNESFLAAYLIVVIPFTLSGIVVLGLIGWRQRADKATWGYGIAVLGGAFILGLQVYVLVLTNASIAVLALLAAATPCAVLLLSVFSQGRRWARALPTLAGALILGTFAVLVVSSYAPVPLERLFGWLDGSSRSPTAATRQLIREGAQELLYRRPWADAIPDRWRWLRPVVGYGPETMYLTYNQVYQPGLARYEPRTASPDRAYNQLLDVGVDLGWVGVATFLPLLVVFVGAGVVIAHTSRQATVAVIATGILGSGLAHLIEAQFGIPTISTRLLFWVGLGMMAALVARREGGAEKVGGGGLLPQRAVSSVLPLALLPVVASMSLFPQYLASIVIVSVGLLLGIAATVLHVVHRSRQSEETAEQGRRLCLVLGSVLAALALVLLVSTGLVANWMLHNSNRVDDAPGGLFARRIAGVPALAAQIDGIKLLFALDWAIVLGGLVGVSVSLPRSGKQVPTWRRRDLVALIAASPVCLLIVTGTVALCVYTSVRPAQADAVYKVAQPYERGKLWDWSIEAHQEAIRLAPRQDFYYLFLGRAFLEKAKSAQGADRTSWSLDMPNVTQVTPQQLSQLSRADLLYYGEAALRRAYELSPLNADHAANLGRLHRSRGEWASDPARRDEYYAVSASFYDLATALSPNKAHLYDEQGVVYLAMGDREGAIWLFEHALALDDQFDVTYISLGDAYLQANRLAEAKEVYLKAVEINPNLAHVHSVLAYIYGEERDYEAAIDETLEVLKLTQSDEQRLSSYENLTVYYHQVGQFDKALHAAQEALKLAPQGERESLQRWIEQLEAEGVDPEGRMPGHEEEELPSQPTNLDFEG
jgi:tetratricopeptide (TPR) repeat protein